MAKINSKQKGARYEREIANEFKQMGIGASRGVQYQGGSESPDVKTNLPIHIECKFTNRFNLYAALSQAKADASLDKVPTVIYRANNKDSVVIFELSKLKEFIAAFRGVFSEV